MCKDLFLGALKEKKRWFYTWRPGFGFCFGMLAVNGICSLLHVYKCICLFMQMLLLEMDPGFLGLDLITLNFTMHGSLGFWKEGRKEEWISVLWPLCSWYNPSSSGVLLNTLFFLMLVFCFGFQRARRKDVWSSLKDLLTVQKWVMRYYNNSPRTPAPWTPACQTSWPSWRPEW